VMALVEREQYRRVAVRERIFTILRQRDDAAPALQNPLCSRLGQTRFSNSLTGA
jgi:hypothetical protein